MVLGVGIDVLEVDRLERAVGRRPRLAKRLFSSSELEYAGKRQRPSMHLAARFCVKEAVAKALALDGWSFSDIELISDVPPAVKLAGRAEARAEKLGATLSVSLTHTYNTAAAVAISYRAR